MVAGGNPPSNNEPPTRFSALQERLLCAAIHFFHRHIRSDKDVLRRMESNAAFGLFHEPQYHSKPNLNPIFPQSVNDASQLHICSFILSILHQGIFSVSALIVSVIYLSRFKEASHVSLHAVTWRPLFLTSLLLADKMWEDKPVRNSSLAKLFPVLSNAELNQLEHRFLREVGFRVLVKPDRFCAFCEQLLLEDVNPGIVKCVVESEYAQTLQQETAQEPAVTQEKITGSFKSGSNNFAEGPRRSLGSHSARAYNPVPAPRSDEGKWGASPTYNASSALRSDRPAQRSVSTTRAGVRPVTGMPRGATAEELTRSHSAGPTAMRHGAIDVQSARSQLAQSRENSGLHGGASPYRHNGVSSRPGEPQGWTSPTHDSTSNAAVHGYQPYFRASRYSLPSTATPRAVSTAAAGERAEPRTARAMPNGRSMSPMRYFTSNVHMQQAQQQAQPSGSTSVRTKSPGGSLSTSRAASSGRVGMVPPNVRGGTVPVSQMGYQPQVVTSARVGYTQQVQRARGASPGGVHAQRGRSPAGYGAAPQRPAPSLVKGSGKGVLSRGSLGQPGRPM
mmetsp:Transcript_108743/g.249389  ORF Transcript_108743/g.249389 Transcript_108743/m.249389 type:complete len:562 (+) Transcript_108743:97-1782(+)|eukprot:CAMPEP_0204323466 /NCGR_PEP_ID=MMETSP0469-20131031/9418_1 /ASSEMBLY_ACC=CAM_ASM_000384 /TAXON_ID=2969 /ORGANISM="Oxyrrhis marina" /LENGTH=561 /DNA_ID=CAMNT_0051304929 /DNA_START=64 /DNA_END=1749 /DNA_ORIENTATION=+